MRRLLLLALISLCLTASRSSAQQMLRNNFENNKLFWTKSIADVPHEVLLHINTGKRQDEIVPPSQTSHPATHRASRSG